MLCRFLASLVISAVVLIIGAEYGIAATAWDEGADGDLSGDRLNPTLLSLVLGSNTVTATSIGGANIDREYFTVNVPDGMQLNAVVLDAYTSNDGIAFVAFQFGTQLTEPPTGTNPANLRGYTHFGFNTPNAVGVNFLPSMNDGLMGFGDPIGFSVPLPSGNYTFWSQQTSSANGATYTFDFQVVPEPAAVASALIGGVFLTAALGRRRKTATRN